MDQSPQALTIDLQTPHGRLRANLVLPPEGMRLAELAWNVMALEDRVIGLASAATTRQGRQVSCKKGCGACCRQVVPLSPPEAWLLRDLVASFPPERIASVLARFAHTKERLEEAGFGQRSLLPASGIEEVQALSLDYFKLGLPCPFLEEESCSIHPQRPSSCRSYLVTSPAALCADPGKHRMQPVPVAVRFTEVLSKLAARLMGGDPFVIPLVLALDWAEEHRELGQERYDAASLIALLVETMQGGPSENGGSDTPVAAE